MRWRVSIAPILQPQQRCRTNIQKQTQRERERESKSRKLPLLPPPPPLLSSHKKHTYRERKTAIAKRTSQDRKLLPQIPVDKRYQTDRRQQDIRHERIDHGGERGGQTRYLPISPLIPLSFLPSLLPSFLPFFPPSLSPPPFPPSTQQRPHTPETANGRKKELTQAPQQPRAHDH